MKRTILSVFLFIFLLFLTMGCEDNPSSEPPRAEYTVTFYSDASNVFQTVKVKEGEKVTKPESEPSILGRGKLKAWVTDLKNEDGTVYDFSKAVTANINLYASYYELIAEYTVTFYSDASTIFKTVKVKEGEKVTKPESDPSISGKGKLKAWVTDLKNEDGTVYDFSKAVTANINLYASYYELIAEYTVTFYSDASTIFKTVKVKEGEKVTKPESDPSISGKGKLKAWVTDLKNEDGTVYDFSKEVTGNINLYASYFALKTVTLYKSDGTTKLRDVYVSYSSPLEKPSDEYIDDCLIKRWVTMEGSEYDFSTPVTVDLELKAECYEKASETDKKEALAYMKIQDLLLSTLEKKSEETVKGFEKNTLAAIYLFSSVKSKQNIDIEKNIYPYWTIDDTNYYLYMSPINSLELSSFLYYEIGDFSCSYYPPTITDEETVIEIDAFKLPITFSKGKYNPETDKVEKDENGTQSSEIITYDKIKVTKKSDDSSSMTLVIGNNPIEYKESNTQKGSVTERTIILAKDGKEYGMKISFSSVTFDPSNGDEPVVYEVLSGTAVSKPSNIPSAPSGYKLFKGWTLDGKAWDFSTPVTENITLKATYWSDAEYKKILEAECIYSVTINLSKCDKFAKGITSGYLAFCDGNPPTFYFSNALLSALFQIDDDGRLYILNNGVKYPYTEENKDTYIVTADHSQINIDNNKSHIDGNTGYIICSNMKLTATYNIKNESPSLGTESVSFDIDGKIETKSDGSVVTTTSFSSGGTNYPLLTTTKTTLSNGRTQIKYEYGEMTFYRVI